MGGRHHHAAARPVGGNQLNQNIAASGIQRCSRLIQQPDRRCRDQRAGQRQPTLLTLAQQPHRCIHPQGKPQRCKSVCTGSSAAAALPMGEVGSNAELPLQPVIVAKVATGGHARDSTAGRATQTCEQPQQRGFASPIGAHHLQPAACCQRESNALKHPPPSAFAGQIRRLQQSRGHHGCAVAPTRIRLKHFFWAHPVGAGALARYDTTMSKTPFLKMHGLGNDFIIVDGRTAPVTLTPVMIRKLSHRFTGIGCDQFIVLEPSARADLFMRIYNQDGGEVEACGNASRCVAVLIAKPACTIETVAGLLSCTAHGDTAIVDMGAPRTKWEDIPLAEPMDTLNMPVGWEFLSAPTAVNVGNPHVVFFVAKASAVDLARLGPLIERDGLFPKRINVNIAEVVDRHEIKLRVWERGAGLTLACGTGACATVVAAVRRGLTERRVAVRLPGGVLNIEFTPDNRLLMGGPVAIAFTGEVDLTDYA